MIAALDAQHARNVERWQLWGRLNNAPLPVYLRFQRLHARHHGGRWLRGVIIHDGKLKFNRE